MRHARKDYDRIQDPSGKIAADEPVFILRARDANGGDAVRIWASMSEDDGADPKMLGVVRAWADYMNAWREAQGGGKVADTPEELLRVPEQFGEFDGGNGVVMLEEMDPPATDEPEDRSTSLVLIETLEEGGRTVTIQGDDDVSVSISERELLDALRFHDAADAIEAVEVEQDATVVPIPAVGAVEAARHLLSAVEQFLDGGELTGGVAAVSRMRGAAELTSAAIKTYDGAYPANAGARQESVQ